MNWQNKLKNKKYIFWNISNISNIDRTTLIEHTLKYGDFDDILEIFKHIDKRQIKDIWLKTMAWDKRFLKINLMIAKIFFNMDVDSSYFKRLDSARFKVRLFVK